MIRLEIAYDVKSKELTPAMPISGLAMPGVSL
jgi:hypothetical protein